MSEVIYKRLLEVRIINDYYLMEAYAENATTSYFSEPLASQSTILQKVLKLEQYNVQKQFEVKPLKGTEKLLQQHKIKWIDTPLGFFLGMEVKQNTSTVAGTTTITYQPKIMPADGLHLQFIINSNNPIWLDKTVLPTTGELNAKFYFTNLNITSSKILPVLSEGPNGWIATEDLNFLPFYLKVNASTGQNIKAQLSKLDNTVIIQKEKIATGNSVQLNLRQWNTYIPDTPPIPDGIYNLKVERNNVVIQQGLYFFSDQYFKESNFGMIDFFFDAQNADYNLLDNQNRLKTKTSITGGVKTITKHPVYELRFNGDFS